MTSPNIGINSPSSRPLKKSPALLILAPRCQEEIKRRAVRQDKIAGGKGWDGKRVETDAKEGGKKATEDLRGSGVEGVDIRRR